MKWLQLFRKFPQFSVAGVIVLASCLAFVFWRLNRGSGTESGKPTVEAVSVPDFALADAVVAGNALVNFRTGEVIAKQWLESFNDSPPSIGKVVAKDQLVIVSGNGATAAFGFDGKAKKSLKADGKPLGVAGFNGQFDEVVFVRDGNLWHGSVNWLDGEVTAIRKVTDTGYFRPDVFRGAWLWHEGDLLVPAMGKTLQIRLASGSVKEVPVNLGQLQPGMSPLGTFALIPVGGRELGVVDLLTGETKKMNVGQRIRKFLWLTPEKAAIHIGNNQVAVYDHATGKLEGPMQSKQGIAAIAAPSPDGSCFVSAGGNGLTVLDLDAKKDSALKLKFTEVEWVSESEMLCSCDDVDTDKRGVWLVKKTGEMDRVSDQPMDSTRAATKEISPVLRVPGGALFISGGDLWSFDAGSRSAKQVTQEQRLFPGLQPLIR